MRGSKITESFEMRFIFLLAAFLIVNHVEAWRHFWRGKSFKKHVLGESNIADGPPDQWFVQKLDHFDVINQKTWNQVREFVF